MKNITLENIIRICVIAGILIMFIKTCSEDKCFDMNEVKEEQYWLVVGKSEDNSSIHQVLFSGKNAFNRDTSFYNSDFSRSEVKINDTIIKNKGEVYFEIRSDEFITRKTYSRDNNDCKVDIEKKARNEQTNFYK